MHHSLEVDQPSQRLSRRGLRGLRVGVVSGPMSEDKWTFVEDAPSSECSLVALTEALDHMGALSIHLDPSEPCFVDKVRETDVLLLNCHGRCGADGRLHGLLDFLGVAYTSCGRLASAVGMDRLVSKAVFEGLGLLTPRGITLGYASSPPVSTFGFPALLKTVDRGSGVGSCLVRNLEELDHEEALLSARGFERLFLEQLVPGRSITISVLQTPIGPRALPALECVKNASIRDEGLTLRGAGAGEATYRWPGDLPVNTLAAMAEGSCEVFTFLQCRGILRLGFIVDAANVPWALEINTDPGLDRKGEVPLAAQLAGISYEDLVAHLVFEAVARRGGFPPAWADSLEVEPMPSEMPASLGRASSAR